MACRLLHVHARVAVQWPGCAGGSSMTRYQPREECPHFRRLLVPVEFCRLAALGSQLVHVLLPFDIDAQLLIIHLQSEIHGDGS